MYCIIIDAGQIDFFTKRDSRKSEYFLKIVKLKGWVICPTEEMFK